MVSTNNMQRTCPVKTCKHFWQKLSHIVLIKKIRQADSPILNSYSIKLTKAATGSVLQKKFCNILRKTAVLKSLLHKVANLQAYNFIKKRLQHRCFSPGKFLGTLILKNICNTASVLTLRTDCLELCFWTVTFKTILAR